MATRIGFFVYEGLTALDIVGPHDVLSRLPGAEAVSIGIEPGQFRADTGVLTVGADLGFADVDALDVLVVPGGVDGTRAAASDARVQEWVRHIDRGAQRVTSVCTGSLILAATGLLQGRRATTHWAAMDQLAGYGAVPVSERVVTDGKYTTAAGVSAGIDMALTLAGELAGDDVAQMIQLGIEYDPDPPYDTGSPHKVADERVELVRGMFYGAA